jgi:hypothetical protein
MGTMVLGIVTGISLFVAIAMTLVAWRIVRNDRRRSAARVARLAAEISGQHVAPADDMSRPGHAAHDEKPLFQVVKRPGLSGGFTGAVVAVVLFAGAVALVISLNGNAEPQGTGSGPAARTATTMSGAAGIELIALGHEREDDRLVVRGRVRIPEHAPELRHLTAVVLLFDQQGGFLTSARADVTKAQLEPGGEAPFAVTIPGATEAGRYRVSFRSDDRVIPHVDRRS